MRFTLLKICLLTLVTVTLLATVPAASASTINLFVGTTQVASMTITQGTAGTCGGTATTTCVNVSVSLSSGVQVRAGGPTIGFSGTGVSASTSVFSVSNGSLSSGPCGGMTAETVCFGTTGSGTFAPYSLVLANATASGITDAGLHIVGAVCGLDESGSPKTCFTTSSSVPPSVPEPGTLSLLGTGLVGLAGLVRRRLLS